MLREIGTVVEADEARGTAVVQMNRQAMCGRCGLCTPGKEPRLTARDPLGAKPGDRVAVDMETADIMMAALVSYGLPAVGLVAGLALGVSLARWLGLGVNPQLVGAMAAAALVAGSFWVSHLYDKRVKTIGRMEPVVTEIVNRM